MEASHNIFPDGSVKEVGVAKVARGGPAIPSEEPLSPRGRRGIMEFGEEFCKKSRVLCGDGEDPKATKLLGNADISPSNLALAPVAGLLAGPEEGATPFVNCLDHPRGEEASTHGMSKHSSQDGVDENKASPDGERPAPPPRELQVRFGDNGLEVRQPQLVSGQG
jgi:hypothetical protein